MRDDAESPGPVLEQDVEGHWHRAWYVLCVVRIVRMIGGSSEDVEGDFYPHPLMWLCMFTR